MIEFLYLNGWGPFIVTLFFFIPFAIVFVYVVYRKSRGDQRASSSILKSLSMQEGIWMGGVIFLFIAFNFMSIGFMPTVVTAKAAVNEKDIQQVDVSARSWSYDISNREIKAGQPVRFSGKSTDTMHSFAVYHSDGDVLFTLMLMPGLENPTSIIHTFNEPGTYTVRCLEFCGVAHHLMIDELVVVQGESL